MSHWRDTARRVIRETLATLPPDADAKAKRAALKDAYPFGPRALHPYKVWLDEVRVQVDSKTPPEKRSAETLKRQTAQREQMSPRNRMLFDRYAEAMANKDGGGDGST